MNDHIDRTMVYVAGPYTVTDPVENTHAAIKVAEELEQTGLFTAYVPHANLLWHLIFPHTVDMWYSYDIAFLSRCDVMLRIPGDSRGADDEESFCKDEGIPVFYSILDLMEWERGREATTEEV